MDVSGATEHVREEWRSHTVRSAEAGLRKQSCLKNPMRVAGDMKKRSDDDAAGVLLEPRLGRVGELA